MAVSLAVSVFVQFIVASSSGEFTEQKLDQTVSSTNEFGFELLRLLVKQPHLREANLFYSPASLSVAIGLVHLGAEGKTKQQISDALNWPDAEQVHSTFKALHESMKESEHKDLVVKMANRIWAHHRLEIGAEFLDNARDFYNAEIAKADFVNQPEESRQEVNRWVEENTARKIRDFIPPGTFNQDTRLALINAIYFKGAWLNGFDPEKTFHGPFHTLGRDEVIEVEMMSRTSEHNYYSDERDDCQVLELPYSAPDHVMMVILPNQRDGIKQLEQKITDEKILTWTLLLENTTVDITIPKFKMTHMFELDDMLPQLGIKDLFDAGKADLSGISPAEKLHVSHVIHKAHVEVNEHGTEAAAASGVIVLDLHPVVYADHPFIFVIYEKSMNSILFVGRVMAPNAVGSVVEPDRFTHDGNEL